MTLETFRTLPFDRQLDVLNSCGVLLWKTMSKRTTATLYGVDGLRADLVISGSRKRAICIVPTGEEEKLKACLRQVNFSALKWQWCR